MKKKLLFIDRDGTILREPPVSYQIDRLDKFEFLPEVITSLSKIAKETDYRLVMVSNQDGLGTPSFPMEDFLPLQNLMLQTLAGEGIHFDEILIDDSFPEQKSKRRKPEIGMVEKYLNELLDYENSYVIGDRETDMQLAKNMGLKGIYIGDKSPRTENIVLATTSWSEVYAFLKAGSRRASISRKTAETAITVELNLNGSGKSNISTGIAFFDHMLQQIARHGSVDLSIAVKGDLDVDEHHTIEDTAIVLGECFREALGSKKGIERYAFALPMDESSAKVLLDFSGRAYLVWDVAFDREYAGGFPTEMTEHFFRSFCQGCACNLQVEARGANTHHKVEAIFKTFARCIRDAVRQTGSDIPSSKGML